MPHLPLSAREEESCTLKSSFRAWTAAFISRFISQFVSVCGVAMSDMSWQLVTHSWPVNQIELSWQRTGQVLSSRSLPLSRTSNNVQHPFPTPNRRFAVLLSSTGLGASAAPHLTGPLATSWYYLCGMWHVGRTLKFTFCFKILCYIYIVVPLIWGTLCVCKEFAAYIIPFSPSSLPEFQHKCTGIAELDPHITSPTRSAKLREHFDHRSRPVELRECLTTTDCDETPSLIFPSTLTIHFITKLTYRLSIQPWWWLW